MRSEADSQERDEADGLRWVGFLWRAVLASGVAIVLYLLSIGPSYRCFRKDSMAQETFISLHGPILEVADRSKPIRGRLDWYCERRYSDAREMADELDRMMTGK